MPLEATSRLVDSPCRNHLFPFPMSAACPVFGFFVEFDLVESITDDQRQSLRSALRHDVLEPRGLSCVDRFIGPRWSLTVRSEASQATHADSQAVEAWADARREITAARIGPLLDLASEARTG
jgi:hypothetical protein